MKRPWKQTLETAALFAVLSLLVSLGGCGGGTAEQAPPPAAPEAAAPAASTDAAVEAKLALADAADGTVDHIVSLCAGCALGMEGNPDYELDLAGYEMRFCSEGCLDRFAKDPQGAVMALAVPAPAESAPDAGGE